VLQKILSGASESVSIRFLVDGGADRTEVNDCD
jgi:hypothetical protein